MGWWSATILGGDEPLDALGEIASLCDIDFCDDDDGFENTLHGFDFTRENFEPNLVSIITNFAKLRLISPISCSVLGAIILYTGSDVDEKLKSFLIDFIKTDQSDEWDNGAERRFYIDDLCAKLENHKAGGRTFLVDESIWDRCNKELGHI
jgi:hypothetical protein